MIEYIGILILFALTGLVAAGMLVVNQLLGPHRPSARKSEPFECGKPPIAMPAGNIPIHFYVMAMLFVVFDVELVFLFPWAVALPELGWFAMLEMGAFLLIVVAGFIYAWRKGALEVRA